MAAFLASFGVIGGDAIWLVPLGATIAHGHLPDAVSYATAPSAGWHDAPALGQLVFWAFDRVFGGLRGLVVAQTVAISFAFAILMRGIRRESSPGGALVVGAVVLAGTLSQIVVTNAVLFSVALFAVLLWLLESEASLWWCVPLFAVWGNLHGGVVIGVGVLAIHVLVARRRGWPAFVAAVTSLCLTPVLWHTPSYYVAVFDGEVAHRGEGLWAPLGLHPLDVLVVLAALVLGILAFRHTRRWEAFALLGLAAATIHVARNAVWLLFIAAYPAARAVTARAPHPVLLVGSAAIIACASAVAIARGPRDPGSEHLAAVAASTGEPVLADGILGQQVALAGGRLWVDNPLEAFRRDDQRLYLDWLDGRGDDAVAHASYVLVRPGSPAARRSAHDARLQRIAKEDRAILYRVAVRPAG